MTDVCFVYSSKVWAILYESSGNVAIWIHHATAVSTHVCIFHNNHLHHGIFHDIVTLVNLKFSCFISTTLHVQRTDHVDTHSPRCPKVLWPRRFLWHVSPTEKNPATRRDAIHAFDLSIEDDLGTTEVAKGNQCSSSSGVDKKDESGNRGFAFAPCFCWQSWIILDSTGSFENGRETWHCFFHVCLKLNKGA